MTPATAPGSPPASRRIAAGVAVAAMAVVGVAVLASGVRGDDGDPAVGIEPSSYQGVVDAVTFAFLTLGMALTIAVFIAQFGVGREERPPRASMRRRLVGVVVVVAVVMLAAPAISRVAERFEVDADAGLGEDQDTSSPASPDGRPAVQEGDAAGGTGDGAAIAGVVVGLIGVVAVAAALGSDRFRKRREPGGAIGPEDPTDETTLVHGLLDDAIVQLRADPDPRRAVITTWARLEVALAAAGRPRGDAETPLAYLERVLVAVRTSAPAVRRLAASFERAMFSPHTIGPDEQAEAVDALVAVRDELGVEATR